MKLLTAVSAILILLLCTSANPATISKGKTGFTTNGCPVLLIVDNSSGAHTINHAKIEWPGFVRDWYPTIDPGSIQDFILWDTPNSMHYPVKVTLWWSSPATAPVKLRLIATYTSTLIGNYTSNVSVSTAAVSGTNANGPTANYCDGVRVEITEGI